MAKMKQQIILEQSFWRGDGRTITKAEVMLFVTAIGNAAKAIGYTPRKATVKVALVKRGSP